MSLSLRTEDCPIQFYKEEIFESFQELFKKSLTQKKDCDFDVLINHCLKDAGIDDYRPGSLAYFQEWFDNIYDMNFIKRFLMNMNNDEVILHGDGKIQTLGASKGAHELNMNQDYIQLALDVFCQRNQIQWNYSNPFCSFYTDLHGFPVRVTLTHFSCTAKRESKAFIRKHKSESFPLNSFSNNIDLDNFMQSKVLKKKNILITGSTGSGKTSLLKSLIKVIPKDEHIICIEDTYELYSQSPFQTTLLADGSAGRTLKDYCSYAMRMSPERIILGEIRSHEVVPFLLSLNTGHKGVMASTHANCAKEGLERLALLYSIYTSSGDLKYETILELLSRNIEYVVHMENKQILEVIKIYGAEGNSVMYESIFKSQKEVDKSEKEHLSSPT